MSPCADLLTPAKWQAAPGGGIIRRRKNTEIIGLGYVSLPFFVLGILAGEISMQACCLGCLGWAFFHTDNATRLSRNLCGRAEVTDFI
jgi:hypothetical protein